MRETAGDIQKRLKGLIIDQSQRWTMLERHFYMYGHSTLQSSYASPFEFSRERVRMNLVQSCVDTLLNKITKNLPRATFLTDDGDWDMQQQAKKREKFVYGQFHKSEVYKKTPTAALSALAYGDGFVKIHAREKQLICDPVLTMSVIVDETECLSGPPRSFFQIALVDKDTLKELYPNRADKIEKMPTATLPFFMSGAVKHRLIEVVEYWNLSITEDGKGHHAILAGDEFLLDEEWKKKRPPFRRLGYVKNLVGYYHKGVAEIVTPWQLEANRTLKRISDSLRLVASPKILMEYQSKIVKAHLNNDVGAIVEYMGTPPQYIMPQAIGSELFNHLQYCVQGAYQDVGISQLSANSAKPAGLNSGKALREYNDIETERFAAFAKNWDNFHVEIAEDCLEVAKEITQKYGKYSVMSPDPKGCEIIDFSKIDMDQDSYLIQVYPTSQMPKDPWGRLEYTQELITGQMLSPEEGMSLLNFPDTEKITSLKTSEIDDILATVDIMLTKDVYMSPEPFQNLEMGIQLMKKAYLKYKNKGCPDDKLDLLYRWVNDALEMTKPPEESPMTATDITPPQEEIIPDVNPMDAQAAPEIPLDQGAEALPPM